MKNFLALISFIIVSNVVFSQQKITFRDQKSIDIAGKLIGTKTEIQDGKESKKVSCYYLRNDKTITISIYGVWTSGSMDFLKVYTFNVDQLNKDNFSEISENEADEYSMNKFYSLSFSTDSEMPFNYSTYNIYSSVPENKSFSVFSIESEAKISLQVIYDDVIKQFPVENQE